MERKSFTDMKGKKGELGSKVIEYFLGKKRGEVKTVNQIMSQGSRGIRFILKK